MTYQDRLNAHCRRRCRSHLERLGCTPEELRKRCPSPAECRVEVGISSRRRGGKYKITTTDPRKARCPF